MNRKEIDWIDYDEEDEELNDRSKLITFLPYIPLWYNQVYIMTNGMLRICIMDIIMFVMMNRSLGVRCFKLINACKNRKKIVKI
jgi:hypothetical protein